MNREIKFKVWDVLGKRMLPFDEVVSTGVDISTPDGRNYQMPLFSVAFVDDKHKLIALQYTGLKDKNDKEIYEGDVVDFCKFIENGVEELGRGKVCFFKGCFWLGEETDFDSYGFTKPQVGVYAKKYLSVVGNIYENPELIETIKSEAEIIKREDEEDEEEDEDLSSCEQCGEHAWDGRICYSCGAKNI